MTRPDIHLYTAATMNGYKPAIFLEEANVPYTFTVINFAKREQKTPEYLKLNPNGKIPTIIDYSEGSNGKGRAIFESGAILWHLANKYQCFLSNNPTLRSETLQWLFFQAAHIGPMMGQAMYFQRIAKANDQNHPFAIQRYVRESRRLLEVLDRRLAQQPYLVDDFSIADMATYPWARAHTWGHINIDNLTHLQAWFDRIDARPAVQKALTVPKTIPALWGHNDNNTFHKENAATFAHDVPNSKPD
ncbi:MAG: glutathione S-transferase N-terminal domain-containing protein [Alphaproteobacteria bacterium GM202ARS2]|nr:glutathione S-transferase N-terminal domain-containing protein [Alphaproteobacteria bacterium GM202ARS2]